MTTSVLGNSQAQGVDPGVLGAGMNGTAKGDQAVHAHAGTAAQQLGLGTRVRLTWATVKQRPLVAILPVLLLVALLTAGIVVVEVQSDKDKSAVRQKTEVQAENTLQQLHRYMEVALTPALNIRDAVLFNPDVKAASGLRNITEQWRKRLPEGLANRFLLAHHDYGVMMISNTAFEENALMSLKWTQDADHGGPPGNPLGVIRPMLESRDMVIKGPDSTGQEIYNTAQGNISIPAFFAMSIPIFVSTDNPNETWGFGPDSARCTSGQVQCYDYATRTKWWGSITVSLQQDVFFSPRFMGDAERNPYQLKLVRNDSGVPAGTTYIMYESPLWASCYHQRVVIRGNATKQSEFIVDMCASSGHPAWRAPMLALVIVLSVALSLMTFWGMLLWAEHSVLLHAVLPPSAISRLKRSATLHTAAEKSQAEMNADTPAERMLMVLEGLVEGVSPPLNTLASLIATLRTRQNLYAPSNLGQRIRDVAGVDEEVAAALLTALGANFVVDEGDEGRTSGHRLSMDRPSSGGQGLGADDTRGFASLEQALRHVTSPNRTTASRMSNIDLLKRQQNALPEGVLRTSAAGSFRNLPWQPTGSRTTDPGVPKTNMSLKPFTSLAAAATALFKPGSGASGELGPTGDKEHVALTVSTGSPTPASPVGFLAAALNSAVPAASGSSLQNVGTGDGSLAADNTFSYNSPTYDSDPSSDRANVDVASPKPGRVLMDELEAVLMTADTFVSFDAFELQKVSGGFPLSALGFWVFSRTGLITQFEISGRTLATFLRAVEGGYLANPYHNNTHAADVLQNTHMLMTAGGLAPHYADRFTHMCAYIAAIAHDYGHKGVTNDFLIATKDDLALQYNDRSPMENYHLSAVFRLMRQDANNFLAHLSDAEWARMRTAVIDMVLATDMKQHFAINGQFAATHQLSTSELLKAHKAEALQIDTWDARVQAPTPKSQPTIHRNAKYMVPLPKRKSAGGQLQGRDTAELQAAAITTPTPLDEAEKQLGLQMALKAADLGNISAPRAVHIKWVAALEEEMFRQGDREKALGLPVSPLCDRGKSSIFKAQVGFFEVVVLPLLTNLNARFPCTRPVLEGALANYCYWHQQQKVASGPGAAPAATPPAK